MATRYFEVTLKNNNNNKWKESFWCFDVATRYFEVILNNNNNNNNNYNKRKELIKHMKNNDVLVECE